MNAQARIADDPKVKRAFDRAMTEVSRRGLTGRKAEQFISDFIFRATGKRGQVTEVNSWI